MNVLARQLAVFGSAIDDDDAAEDIGEDEDVDGRERSFPDSHPSTRHHVSQLLVLVPVSETCDGSEECEECEECDGSEECEECEECDGVRWGAMGGCEE